MNILYGKADFCFYFIRRNINRNALSLLKALDCTENNFFGKFSCFSDIGMTVVIFIAFRAGESCRFACSHNRCLETAGDFHNRGEYILHISNPEVKRTRSEH